MSGQLVEQWPLKPLSELCEFRRGLTYKKGDQVELSSTPVLRATNISLDSNALILDDLRYISDEFVVPENKRVIPESILMCIASGSKKHLGKVAFVENIEPLAFGGFMGLLVPKSEVYPKYLYYSLISPMFKDWIAKLSDGTNINNLNFSKIENFQICLPPLDEQQRIVSILDEAFENVNRTLSETDVALKNADELFEARLNNLFKPLESDMQPVDMVCESIVDCINKTAPRVEYETPFRMIRTTNVRNGRINLEKVRYVAEEIYQQWIRRQTPEKGDVILTREAPLGEVGMLIDDKGVFLGQRLVAYRTSKSLMIPKFLVYSFRSGIVQKQIKALGSGSTVQHMRVPDSKKLQVPLPSLDKQNRIVEELDYFEKISEDLRKNLAVKISKLNDFKQSILQEAFNGTL